LLISDGPSTIMIEVPLTRLVRVADRAPAPDAGLPDSQNPELAVTGVDTASLVMLGVVLIGVGFMLLPAAMRRKTE
jgi:hypothetical protein